MFFSTLPFARKLIENPFFSILYPLGTASLSIFIGFTPNFKKYIGFRQKLKLSAEKM